MLKDIATRADIEELMTGFYSVAMTDEGIGHFFTQVVRLDLDTHLPVIVDFWDKIVFGRPVYFGNPLLVHQEINAKAELRPEHFERWVTLFTQTVERLFAGPNANLVKQKAAVIAQNLSERLAGQTPPGLHAIARRPVS